MGRPPLKSGDKVRPVTVWLHERIVAEITALVGPNKVSTFMREAAEIALRKQRKRNPPAQSRAEDSGDT